MRFIPSSVNHPKRLAKRMRKASLATASRKMPKISLSMAQKAVAACLGFRDWFELNRTIRDPVIPCSLTDRNVSDEERVARRNYQAERLATILEIPDNIAYALVMVLLPSGDVNEERFHVARHPVGRVDPRWMAAGANLGLRQGQAFWADVADTMEQFGLDGTDLADVQLATGAVLERITFGMGPGYFRIGALTDGEIKSPGEDRRGYFGVFLEDRNFYQGYYLADTEEEDVAKQIGIMTDTLAESGVSEKEMPAALKGLAEASLCEIAGRPEKAANDERKMVIFSAVLSSIIDARFFMVFGEERSGGFETFSEVLAVDAIDAARDAINGHPVAVRCKAAIMGKLKTGFRA